MSSKNIILCVWMFCLESLECLVPVEDRECAGCPETGVNSCEPPCGYCQSKLGPLKEQLVL